MKNVLIIIMLASMTIACSSSKHSKIDSQFTNTSSHAINGKYNSKNCIYKVTKDAELAEQIALTK